MSLEKRHGRPGRVFVIAFALAFLPIAAKTAHAYHTNFVGGCHYNPPQPTSTFRRDGAIAVALVGRYEGYQYGGGCWNDNNVDDSPGDPQENASTRGEGGDCSGFTFKIWKESENSGDAAAYQWNRMRNVHGPYSAAGFKSGAGAPNVTYGKSGLIKMDALASSSHVGMIYAKNADGTDQIIEAKGEAYGTNIWTRTYRGNSSYGGVRRLGWTG
jgi:hypothetical protein